MRTRKSSVLIWFWVLMLWTAPLIHPKTENALREDLTDGPYLFYLSNERIVCSVENGRVEIRRYKGNEPLLLDVPGVDGLRITIPPEPVRPDADGFRNVNKIFAISDVHGQFFRMKDILTGNGIMDNKFKWTYGKNHLVIVGDVFDRGPMVTECLWLLFHLQSQAVTFGGRVHVLLGNHDQMVMRADLRYVNKRYTKISKLLKRIRYQDLFGPDTFLGKWLRSRNAVIKLNDILFVHAGIHPYLMRESTSIPTINRTVRRHMDSRSYVHAFNPLVSFIFGRNGVFWSRGYFSVKGYDPVSEEQLKETLEFYNASRIVVGHTRFDHVGPHLNGRVLSTAVNTEEDQPAEGLLIQEGRFFRADDQGNLAEIII